MLFRSQRIRRYYNSRSAIVVGTFEPSARLELLLRLESLTISGAPLAVAARAAVPAPQARRAGSLQQRGVTLGPLSALGANLWFQQFENAGDTYVVPSGITSDWVTVGR